MFRPIFHKQLISCIDEIESSECRIANTKMVLKRAFFTFFVLAMLTGMMCKGVFLIPAVFFIVCTVFYGYLLFRLSRVLEFSFVKALVIILAVLCGAVLTGIGLREGIILLWDKYGWYIMRG